MSKERSMPCHVNLGLYFCDVPPSLFIGIIPKFWKRSRGPEKTHIHIDPGNRFYEVQITHQKLPGYGDLQIHPKRRVCCEPGVHATLSRDRILSIRLLFAKHGFRHG